MAALRKFIQKHREILLYLVFGVLTTIVNWCVYFPVYNFVHLSATVSNVMAWIVAVLFAFVTNKPIVFESKDWRWQVTGPELAKFVGCRVGSGVLESLFMLVTVDILHFNGNVMKVIIAIAVIVINYIGSKLLFHKK